MRENEYLLVETSQRSSDDGERDELARQIREMKEHILRQKLLCETLMVLSRP